MTPQDRDSLVAATQAGHAMVELMRFHAEGPASDRAFGDVDVILFLAESLSLACRIEVENLAGTHHAATWERDEVAQLGATCAAFLADHT